MKFSLATIVLILSALVFSWPEQRIAKATQPTRNPRFTDLRNLSIAIFHSSARDGFLPAARTDTVPPCSWRVAILPLLDCATLSDEYDSGEPWDGPNNRELLTDIPEHFTPYTNIDLTRYFPEAPRPSDTSYLAVVDDRTMWPRTRIGTKRALDGFSETILLIEAPELRVPWTEPRDLTFEEAVELLKKPAKRYYDSFFYVRQYEYTRAIGFLDGHNYELPPLSAEVAAALLTRSGREDFHFNHEVLPWPESGFPPPRIIYKWDRIGLTAVAGICTAAAIAYAALVRRRRTKFQPQLASR